MVINTKPSYLSPESCMRIKKQQLELCMEQLIGSVAQKFSRAVHCPCLFNLYAEHIMRNAGLDDLQVGIKIGGRNINNLRYAEDTTLMAESKEELKPLGEGLREEWKTGLKLNIKKLKSDPITSW